MIQMEYIQRQDRQLIAYRGKIRFADGVGGSQQIVEDAYIRVPGGWTPEADKQCMLTVVNKLLKKAKKQMVQSLMTQFRLTRSFDTIGTTRRRSEEGWHITSHTLRDTLGGATHLRLRARRSRVSLEANFSIWLGENMGDAVDIHEGMFYLDRVPESIRERSEIIFSHEVWPPEPDHPNCRSTVDVARRPAAGNPEMNYRAAMAMLRQASGAAGIAFPGAFCYPPRKLRNTPDRRAMALLYRKIGRIRVRYMKKFGYFEEQGQHGLYRFHKDKQGGVTFIQEIEVGGLKKRPVQWDLCVQSQAPDLPPGDVILSRWLAWKADEDQFLATANFRNISTVDEATARPEVTIYPNALNWDQVAESMVPVLRQMGHRE